MTRACTYVDREVRVAIEVDVVYTVSQFLYVRYVLGQIDIQIEREVFQLYRCRVDHHFETFVGDQTGIDPFASTPGSSGGHFHDLVLRAAIIIGKVKSQTVVEELHIQTCFVRRRDFRFQLVVHFHVRFAWNQLTFFKFKSVRIV